MQLWTILTHFPDGSWHTAPFRIGPGLFPVLFCEISSLQLSNLFEFSCEFWFWQLLSSFSATSDPSAFVLLPSEEVLWWFKITSLSTSWCLLSFTASNAASLAAFTCNTILSSAEVLHSDSFSDAVNNSTATLFANAASFFVENVPMWRVLAWYLISADYKIINRAWSVRYYPTRNKLC